MDEAVWDASYYQDVQPSSFSGENTGLPLEVLLDTGEEDVLNEISCLQVLRILITNANAEIAQLEDDLVTLQCELALANDAWSEKCSDTLQQEIKILDILILKLKNGVQKGELEFDFEPAKRMHEMLKFLLDDDHLQTNDKVLHEADEDYVIDTLNSVGGEALASSVGSRMNDEVKNINQFIEIASSLESNAAEQKNYLHKNLTLELPLQAHEHSKPSMETMEFESEDQEQLVAEAKVILEERIQAADCEKKEENDSSTTLSSLLRVAIHRKRNRKSQKIKVQEADICHSEDCEKASSQMQNTMREIINNEEQIEELKQGSVLKPQKSKPKGRVPAFHSGMSPQTNNSIQLNFNGRIMVQKALSDVAETQGHKESPKQTLKERRRKRSKSSSQTWHHQIFPPKVQEMVVETMYRSSTSDPGEKTLNPLSPSTEESQIIEVILDLNCLSLIELKSMAKALKMSGYTKLKKPQLQEQVKLELKAQGCLTS